LPSGKAVLNLPARRMARAYSVPEALKSLSADSGERFAIMPSTSDESVVLLSKTVFFRSAAGVPENAPPAKYQMLSIWLVTTSLVSIPSGVMESQVGRCAAAEL